MLIRLTVLITSQVVRGTPATDRTVAWQSDLNLKKEAAKSEKAPRRAAAIFREDADKGGENRNKKENQTQVF